MNSLVSQWYEEKKNVEEMRGWNPALKAWEREVAGHFPSGARLLDFFDHVVTGDMVTHSKPHPEIFLKAGALSGAAPSEIWVIEDSYNGIRAAHAAGMRPLMIPDLIPPDEEMRRKAEVILPDLFSARDYLLALTDTDE